jgi:DNA polymerase-3 subunit delta'
MPQDLIGNSHAKEFLQRILTAGRLPGAFLFAGPDGVGKKQFALEIARSVLCKALDGLGGCGKCSICLRIGTFVFPTSDKKEDYHRVFFGGHADVGMTVPFKRSILVDSIRALEREANFRPYEGTARFFLINDADKMNPDASNALLKTLEEPAPTTHIILLTSRFDSLLQTIKSRCQVLRFQPIDPAEIANYLVSTKTYSPEDAALVARISRGSLGRALQLSGEELRERREAMLEILEAQTSHSDRAKLLRAAEQMGDARAKDEYEPRLEILQSLLHDTWQLKQGRAKETLVNADLNQRLEKCADNTTSENLVSFLAAIEKIREDLLVNINRKIATDTLFMSAAK